MERLTTRCSGYAVMAWEHEEKHTTQEWIDMLTDRLAAYEDTGLEPEQVLELKSFIQGGIHKVDDGWKHVQELLQAEQDGRLVVLPCKVGDTVFRVFTVGTREPLIKEVVIKTAGEAADLIGRIGKKNMLVSVFRTREEAEAALAGKGSRNE